MLMICRDNKLHYQLFIGVSEIKANTNRKMDGWMSTRKIRFHTTYLIRAVGY